MFVYNFRYEYGSLNPIEQYLYFGVSTLIMKNSAFELYEKYIYLNSCLTCF